MTAGSQERRRLLLQRKLTERGLQASTVPAIPQGNDTEPAPLTLSQQRLWLFDQLAPGSAAYNMPAVLRLRGPLNRDRLLEAITVVGERHPALATVFESVGGLPTQRVGAAKPIEPVVHDLRGRAGSHADAEATALVAETLAEPFDLASGRLVRLSIIVVADDEHLLICNAHHIVVDARSWDVLIGDLVAHYRGHRLDQRRRPSFADWARWERQRRDDGELDSLLAWWSNQLAGAPATIELPTDRQRPRQPSFRGDVVQFQVDGELRAGLDALSRAANATMFMTTLAVFSILLERYSGAADLLVATPVEGRHHPDVGDSVGFFVDTLPLRLAVDPSKPFAEILDESKERVVDALDHQGLPIERLAEVVEDLEPGSSRGFPQVLFSYRAAPEPFRLDDDVVATYEPHHNGTAKRDLTLHLVDHGDHLHGELEVSLDAFQPSTMDRMVAHFLELARAVTANPRAPVRAHGVLVDDERRLIADQRGAAPDADVAMGPDRTLDGGSETYATSSHDRPAAVPRGLHHRFEAIAAETPDATAVVFGQIRLTYGDVNRSANALARTLLTVGLRREDRVGLLLPSSPELVISILAVLKAGGAYMPFDLDAPASRHRSMIDDADVSMVLTRPGEELAPSTSAGIDVISIDARTPGPDAPEADNLDLEIGYDQAAYVLFTSGSSGRPKGVVVEHRNVLAYLDGYAERIGFAADASFVMAQPAHVDSSVTMLFGALTTGGRLDLLDRSDALNARSFRERYQQSPYDYLKIAPSHLQALLGPDGDGIPLPQTALIVGGEGSDREWLDRLADRPDGPAVHNHYGPTETTVGVTSQHVGGSCSPCCGRGPVAPIGMALPGTNAYVLDRYLRPTPIGVVGELYIGGANVARGYIGRPELTAGSFVPDPFRSGGARMYRTGDRAQLCDGGSLHFLGRDDGQVKVRGVRVELAEIERAALDTGLVDEARARVRAKRGVDELALVVAGTVDDIELEGQLRTGLRQRLPAVMVPTIVVVVAELPRTAHGKVDLRALDELGPVATPQRHATAVGSIERQILSVWTTCLDRPEVGADDNFFDVGGHSILVLRLHAALEAELAIDIDLVDLFTYTTIRSQAMHLGGVLEPRSTEQGVDRGRRQNERRRARRARAASQNPSQGRNLNRSRNRNRRRDG